MCSSSLPLDTGAPEPSRTLHVQDTPNSLLHLLNFQGWLYVVHFGVGSWGCQHAGNTSNRTVTVRTHSDLTVSVLRRLECRCIRLPKTAFANNFPVVFNGLFVQSSFTAETQTLQDGNSMVYAGLPFSPGLRVEDHDVATFLASALVCSVFLG